MKKSIFHLLISINTILTLTTSIDAFSVNNNNNNNNNNNIHLHRRIGSKHSPQSNNAFVKSSNTVLYSSSFTNPSQEKSVELGIREWPQQTKTQSSWDEDVKDGESLTRYILQGNGDLIVNIGSDAAGIKPKKFGPGVLIEVTGPASLNWVKKGSEDVIILTPGYEQGGQLIGFAFATIILCGALINLV